MLPNRLKMPVVGGGRPILHREGIIVGRGANQNLIKALGYFAKLKKLEQAGMTREDADWAEAFRNVPVMFDDIEDQHREVARIFVPGATTPATAEGYTKLNSAEGWLAWVWGVKKFDEIQQLPAPERLKEHVRIAQDTWYHKKFLRSDAQ